MPTICSIAFKEWAAVCEALAAGRQAIILRKGGIHEGREGFRVQHERFWLYPTNFHQQAECLSPDAAEFIRRAAQSRPASGQVPIRLLADVHAVHELPTEASALRLAGEHLWSAATVRQRFAYRRPGLCLLVMRIFARSEAVLVTESAAMAGCKSWVELPEAISTDGLAAVLSDAEFAERVARIEGLLVS
jgi:hypothetical protein